MSEKSKSANGAPWFGARRLYRALNYRSGRIAGQFDFFLITQYLKRLGIKNPHRIPTHTSQRELTALFNLAITAGPEAAALEIGSYLGASACYLASGLAINKGHLYCVDTWQNETMPEGERETYKTFQQNTRGLERFIIMLRKHSQELTNSDFPGNLKLVFIDGDHSYTSVKNDFEIASARLSSDGVISFHDASGYFDGVMRVVGGALATGQWSLAGFIDSLVWIKPTNQHQIR